VPPLTRDVDEVSFTQLLDSLTDGARYCTVAAEVTADISNCFSGANGMCLTGCIHGNLTAALLDAHKEFPAIAVSKGFQGFI